MDMATIYIYIYIYIYRERERERKRQTDRVRDRQKDREFESEMNRKYVLKRKRKMYISPQPLHHERERDVCMYVRTYVCVCGYAINIVYMCNIQTCVHVRKLLCHFREIEKERGREKLYVCGSG